MNSVVIVSGGSRGLGAAIVANLLDAGCRVATFSRSSSAFVQEWTERDPEGRRFHWAELDGTERDKVQAFVRDVRKRFSEVNGLVNCAAVAPEGLLALTRPEEIEETVAINLLAPIWLTTACVKCMLAQGSGGSIVNISSINAHRGRAGVGIYSATKAALEGLTRSLAKELGPQKVRVNAVAPGYFSSELTGNMAQEALKRIAQRTPLGRLGTVDDVVGTVRFLLSEQSSFVTGQTIIVDGGITA